MQQNKTFLNLAVLLISQFLPVINPKTSHADNPTLPLSSGSNPFGIAVNLDTNAI
jgi:streptogramin lyase